MGLPQNPADDAIRGILKRTRRIAVIGLSPKPFRDSHRVSAYMQRAGYDIVPVYPRQTEILGARVFRSIAEVDAPVDMVNVFRRAEDLEGVASEILSCEGASKAVVWFQLDCVNEKALDALAAAGREVVYDRCLMVEHARLARG
jgi:uncharacterized protein